MQDAMSSEPGQQLLHRVDFLRLDANRGLQSDKKSELGQFMTPASVARLMASLLKATQREIRLLDAGAGVGSLSAAVVAELCRRKKKPRSINVSAFEIDPHLTPYLADTMKLCKAECRMAGIEFLGKVIEGNFLQEAADVLGGTLFSREERFNCAILNPPYRKIGSNSEERRLLRLIEADSSNLYTGFLAAAVHLLEPGGEMVTITPRSFCNGSYFKSFRKFFLNNMQINNLHVFESRQHAFKDDSVLQENVIMRASRRKGNADQKDVIITSSEDADDDEPLTRVCPYREVVRPDDTQFFIHVAADTLSEHVTRRMSAIACTIKDLELQVSTGRVVDFRVKDHLRKRLQPGSVPLIWPLHFSGGYIKWPKHDAKKAEAIFADSSVESQLVPNENYVLVRRFSAKEEKRRVVAAVYDSKRIECDSVGIENHVNYYHQNGRGIDIQLAKGLAAFLNSTLVDAYFRQFNGHTQVNATDLRSLSYPSVSQLVSIGRQIGDTFPEQSELDQLINERLGMMDDDGIDPAKVREKVEKAGDVLRALGLPRQQLNERSALTLLALLGLAPEMPWSEASRPLCGITPMMDFFRDHYGKDYKPNTRETVRRQTVHQFLDAGLVVANPDKPKRPVNSPKAVYQIETNALELLRAVGSEMWERSLAIYLSKVATLKAKYAQEREMARIPIKIAEGMEISLSPGGQNVLVKEIIDQFAPRFASPGQYIYVGDTDEKYAYFDKQTLADLGVELDAHGKMPDVIIHYTEKSWLLLIEAVTSHGPINAKRRDELKKLFGESSSGLVYVTTFLNRKAMLKYLNDISWETEVWVADHPTHMIHFNGKRFLGPYPE